MYFWHDSSSYSEKLEGSDFWRVHCSQWRGRRGQTDYTVFRETSRPPVLQFLRRTIHGNDDMCLVAETEEAQSALTLGTVVASQNWKDPSFLQHHNSPQGMEQKLEDKQLTWLTLWKWKKQQQPFDVQTLRFPTNDFKFFFQEKSYLPNKILSSQYNRKLPIVNTRLRHTMSSDSKSE